METNERLLGLCGRRESNDMGNCSETGLMKSCLGAVRSKASHCKTTKVTSEKSTEN
jgi:hypothetical protein